METTTNTTAFATLVSNLNKEAAMPTLTATGVQYTMGKLDYVEAVDHTGDELTSDVPAAPRVATVRIIAAKGEPSRAQRMREFLAPLKAAGNTQMSTLDAVIVAFGMSRAQSISYIKACWDKA